MYGIIETKVDFESTAETNFISIRNTREEAIKDIARLRSKFKKRAMRELHFSSDDFEECVHTDLDAVFDFCTDSGELEYHVIACEPIGISNHND